MKKNKKRLNIKMIILLILILLIIVSIIATLTLKNRDIDNPYYIIIDFGVSKNVSAIGMDFMCIPKYTKMEAHLEAYNNEENRNDGNDYIQDTKSGDYFLVVQELTDNRISVVQSTWSGSGHSVASKLKFSLKKESMIMSKRTNFECNDYFSYKPSK